MVKKSKNCKKSQKITFFQKKNKIVRKKMLPKKCYSLSFPILVSDSRGGGPLSVTKDGGVGRKKSLCLILEATD